MRHSKFYIIGCGGVGSWLAHSLARLVKPQNLVLVDGDYLEEGNLDRQLFTKEDIGRNKAEALMDVIHAGECRSQWFEMGLFDLQHDDWLLVCVDNHPSRHCALQECDINGCEAIFAANETLCAEAFYYTYGWKGTPRDPRVYYPEIATSRADDPRRAAIGCTGQAQEENRQLVSANFMAAALAQHLLVLWHLEYPGLDKDAREALPYLIRANMTRFEVVS